MIFLHRDGYLSICLHCICMKENAMTMCDLADLMNLFNRSNLVIGIHYGNQDRIRSNRTLNFLQTDKAFPVNIQIGNLVSQFCKPFTSVKDCRMLNLCRDNMLSFIPVCLRNSLYSPVVRFCPTTCKKNFFIAASDCCCNLFFCMTDCTLRRCTDMVHGAGIAILFRKPWKHSFHGFLVTCSCCCVIQINQFFHAEITLFPV